MSLNNALLGSVQVNLYLIGFYIESPEKDDLSWYEILWDTCSVVWYPEDGGSRFLEILRWRQ
jgi:hypothetical protein